MFRLFRTTRGVLSASTLPWRLEARLQRGEKINVQKVRLRKPATRSILVNCATIYFAYLVYTTVVLDPLENALLASIPNDESQEADNEEDILFIPFPGTTKQISPTPYKATDPEWQEFVKLSKDPALLNTIKGGLAEYVRRAFESTGKYGRAITLKRVWLEHFFPSHPPPEFQRSGIEITDDYLAWTTTKVEPSVVFKLRQALWPTAMVSSTWSFAKALFADETFRVRRFFGFKDTPSTAVMSPQTALSIMTGSTEPIVVDKEAAEYTVDLGKSRDAIKEHFAHPISVFKSTYKTARRRALIYPPRGCMLISGSIELDTPSSVLLLDVRAFYDPKNKVVDGESMDIVLKKRSMKVSRALSSSN